MAISVTVNSNTGSYQGGTYNIGPLTIVSAFASLQVNSLTFGSAMFISTTGPAGAYGVVIEPPANSLVNLTLKGITGDTGLPTFMNTPQILTFGTPSSASTVGITSAAQVTAGVVTLTWF